MVEILLVVGFIALASIGIYAVYNKMVTSYQAHQEYTNLQTIVSGVQQLYANQQNYTGLTTQVVRNARIAPQQMHTGGPTGLVNSFGGKVEVYSYMAPQGPVLTIHTYGIPSDVCIKLVSLAHPSFTDIAIDSDGVVKTYTKPNFNLDTALWACDYFDTHDIEFKIRKSGYALSG